MSGQLSPCHLRASRCGSVEQGENYKSFDKIDPWLVTRDEVADRQGPVAVADREWRDDVGRIDPNYGMQRRPRDQLPVSVHHAPYLRHHFDRHAAGRRHEDETAALSEAGRRGGTRHRESDPATAGCCRRPVTVAAPSRGSHQIARDRVQGSAPSASTKIR
jgi:hypothetical protein